jgi:hypothetical protein
MRERVEAAMASKTSSSSLDRRRVVLAGSALFGAAALPNVAAANDGLGSAADLLAATRKFLASLEPDGQKAARFAWNGAEWRAWNYFGVGGYIKPGLRLEQMTAPQKEAAWALLSVLFSPTGIEKTRNVMTLQDVLAASGNGAGQRSSERFSFSVFGEPAETGPWGFRLEGHHLTQSISVRDNRIVSVTPSSFSALPNRITSGKHAGLITLKDEEALARRLANDLAAKQRVKQSEQPLYNIMSYAGRERANAQKVGIAAADLTTGQRDLLWQLVDTYSVDYLMPALAAAQKTRVRAGDQAAVHFAWYGANTPEKAFGYRVIGDNFVIELGSVDAAAQHLHTIYNDLDNVLGRAG